MVLSLAQIPKHLPIRNTLYKGYPFNVQETQHYPYTHPPMRNTLHKGYPSRNSRNCALPDTHPPIRNTLRKDFPLRHSRNCTLPDTHFVIRINPHKGYSQTLPRHSPIHQECPLKGEGLHIKTEIPSRNSALREHRLNHQQHRTFWYGM